MRLKTIIEEDFVNYREASFFIGCISCGGKCAKEGGFDISVCQNDSWRSASVLDMSDRGLIERYLRNDITKAIVFGLLEPFEQFTDLLNFIGMLRDEYKCPDPVVIYTGYEKDELVKQLEILKQYRNIIVKFGRFRLGDTPHYDPVLGVSLASDNQYAEWIS